MQVIMKGYGELKLANNESVSGEITLYQEGWVVVAPVPPADRSEVRWFPVQQVQEVVWRKSLALRPPRPRTASTAEAPAAEPEPE